MNEQLPALGFCPNCRQEMIAENGKPKCFNCQPVSRPKHLGPKPKPVTYTPTDKDFKQLQKAVEIPVTNPKQLVVGKAEVVVQQYSAQDALHIMRNLLLPKDEKEFKQIKKIIKQLEQLVGE